MGGGPAKAQPPANSEDFEVLDVRGTARTGMSWLQQFAHDVTKEPVAKQAAIGGITGWVAGYLSMKVGKAAATAVGGSLIIIQLAAHKGYIKVDWSRVNKDLEKNAKKIQREVENQVGTTGSENLGRGPSNCLDDKLQKMAYKLDRKLDKLEHKTDNWLTKKASSAERLYRKYILGDNSRVTVDDLYLINMYILAFSAGTMLGMATGKLV